MSRSACIMFLAFSLSACALSCCGAGGRDALPVAGQGVIDLSKWDFDREGTLKLDGEWEFYWKKLLASEDFAKIHPPKKSGFLKLPAAWNGAVVDGETLGSEGYATFRLTVLLGKTHVPLSFRLIDMRTTYALFVNGKKIASNGRVGTSRETSVPQYLPVVAAFAPHADRMEIVLQVSNYHHAKGGPFHSIHIGKTSDIRDMRDLSFSFQIFMLGSLLIMGLYHLGMFIIRRNDRSSLFLAIFCLLISFRPMVTGEYYLIWLLPETNWELMLKSEYLTLYLGLPAFALFMNSLFPVEFPKKILNPILALGGIFSLIVIATPARIYSHTVLAYEAITLLASAYTVYAIILSAVRKREGSKIFILGTLVLMITVTNEILFDNMVVNTGNFFPFGLFVFVLSQAFLMSIRFTRAFDNIEELSLELEDKNMQLISIDRLKDEFLANTSHELRTPLNGIIGIAESLLDGAAGTLPDQVNSNLGMIISSGKRLSNLINDLLDFSKLRNKDIKLKLKPVDIKTLADVAIDLTSHLKKTKSIAVINSIPTDIPLILADEERMQQILINLVGNAIKFTDAGWVDVSAQVLIGEDPEYSLLEVTVSDSGIGIPEDKVPVIFHPFEQGDGSIARIYGGTGIGLSITKDLIRLHGGYIEVESDPGKGSSFTFRMPLRRPIEHTAQYTDHRPDSTAAVARKFRPAVEPAGINAAPPLPENAAPDQPTILVVDDDPVNLRVIENQLSVKNYTVITSTSGIDALNKINTGLKPDLMILDIMMPKMSGLEVARTVREQFSLFDLPIMMLTAKSRASDMATGMEAGANDYLSKPFDKTELLSRVKTLIRMKKTGEENKKLTSIKQEMALARTIHLATLPKQIPRGQGLEIAVKYIPTQIIGGDYYDFHEIGGGRIGAFIADISGHGVPAALLASMFKITFYMLKDMADAPIRLMNEMNRILTGNIENQFATAGYVLVDREKMKLCYTRCGHEPLILFRKKNNDIMEFTPAGRLIGYAPESNCEVAEADLQLGDRIILYTDGITEVYNKDREIFNSDFLKNTIVRCRDLSGAEFAESLTGTLRRWHGLDEDFEDDVTMVVLDIV
ncbi:MAG: SpoIIE family protein phosphatase [Spirochaetes bacterium]|nr:SpoIIE family protein phosphatase [Spirochaetota bacterium]